MSFQMVLRSNETCSCCCRRSMAAALPALLLQHTIAYLHSRGFQTHHHQISGIASNQHRLVGSNHSLDTGLLRVASGLSESIARIWSRSMPASPGSSLLSFDMLVAAYPTLVLGAPADTHSCVMASSCACSCSTWSSGNFWLTSVRYMLDKGCCRHTGRQPARPARTASKPLALKGAW